MLNTGKIQFAADTNVGLRRKHNEDCYEADAALGLWLVADGVGGHSRGDLASDIVRITVRSEIIGGATLANAVAHAHRAVLEEIGRDETARGMGSTIVALRLEGENYQLAWVGDSRAYLWNSHLQQLSHDHNRVSELLDQGIITPQQATRHPERHVLTQSLGVSERMALAPGSREGILGENQQILLCSDGLTDELSDEKIATIMADKDNPHDQVKALIDAALRAGGNDNVTAIVIGSAVGSEASTGKPGLDITGNSSQDRPRGDFPIAPWLLMSALLLLAAWFLL